MTLQVVLLVDNSPIFLHEEGYRDAALTAGADVFLLKDGLAATLLPAISDVSRGRAAE